MDALDNFKKELVSIIGEPAIGLRPFVCEGSPLDCKVFIVGYNPATPMSTNFWKFWDSEYGFDKNAWHKAYKSAREREKKSKSSTRTVIGIVVDTASPVRILETNIYAKEAKRPRDVRKKDKDTRPIDFLIESVRPHMIVAHGVKAQRYLLDKYPEVHVEPAASFSYGFPHAEAFSIGQQIKAKYGV